MTTQKMTRLTASLLLTGALLMSACTSRSPQNPALDGLDGYLAARQLYEVRKLDQIEALRKILPPENGDALQRYSVAYRIADEFFSYKYDSTRTWLLRCREIADKMGSRPLQAKADIRLGELYAMAGYYGEADRLLAGIDPDTLPEELQGDFYYSSYKLAEGLQMNAGMAESVQGPDRVACRDRLLALLPAHSDRWRELQVDAFLDAGQIASADSLNRLLIKAHHQEEHRYAVVTYVQSVIETAKGDEEACLSWLIESAGCDVINAVKDYASLTVISQILTTSDVDRAFRYLCIAQEDAIFYNARLRPWQISQFFMNIENQYMARNAEMSRRTRSVAILMSLIALALMVALYFLVKWSRKLSRTQKALVCSNRQLEEANLALNDLNRQISKADQVKEAYILDFLRDLSDQIAFFRSEDNRSRNLLRQGKADQLLKELSISDHSEKAREKFYETFDRTFLGMYPDFVEQFNSLLREDARFSPPKGRLTTELRIFALIRLGIDDSKEIAAMLDYSVSTIYNYKVSVRNSALGDRNTLEERVRQVVK